LSIATETHVNERLLVRDKGISFFVFYTDVALLGLHFFYVPISYTYFALLGLKTLHTKTIPNPRNPCIRVIRDSDELSPVKFYGRDVLHHPVRLGERPYRDWVVSDAIR